MIHSGVLYTGIIMVAVNLHTVTLGRDTLPARLLKTAVIEYSSLTTRLELTQISMVEDGR